MYKHGLPRAHARTRARARAHTHTLTHSLTHARTHARTRTRLEEVYIVRISERQGMNDISGCDR